MSEPLQAKRTLLMRTLATRLAADDASASELRDLRDRLALIDLVLGEHQPARRRGLATWWPVLAVALVLAVASLVEVPNVPLTLELRASAVSLVLRDAAEIEPLELRAGLRAEGVGRVESPDGALMRAVGTANEPTIAVRATQGWLRGVQVPGGGALEFARRGEGLALQVQGSGQAHAEVEMRGRTGLRIGDAAPFERTYEPAEWLRVASRPGAAGAPAPALELTLDRVAEGTTLLREARPASLRFVERRAGQGAFSSVASSVEGGTIELPATGESVKLAGGEWLEVDGLQVERCSVTAAAGLLVRFNGSARRLVLRSGEFERSLKPSWLEYIARHHLVKLLWGSAAVLWGALAWVRGRLGGG